MPSTVDLSGLLRRIAELRSYPIPQEPMLEIVEKQEGQIECQGRFLANMRALRTDSEPLSLQSL